MTPPLPGTGSTQSSSPSVRSPPAPSGCCFQTRSVSRNNIASPPAFSYTETPDLGCKPSIICSRRLQATLTSFMLMCAILTCYTPQRQAYPAAYIAPVLIMAHHLVADRITAIHGTGNTSVRADGEKIKENSTFKYLAWFYSQFQINSVILPMRQLLCCSLFFLVLFFVPLVPLVLHSLPDACTANDVIVLVNSKVSTSSCSSDRSSRTMLVQLTSVTTGLSQSRARPFS